MFRLHDPLNDVENLRAAAARCARPGGRLYAGLAFSGTDGEPRPGGREGEPARRARRRPRAAARPRGRARPGHLRPGDRPLAEASGSRSASTARAPAERAGDGDRGGPRRCRADRGGLLPDRVLAEPGGRRGAVRGAGGPRHRARASTRPAVGGRASTSTSTSPRRCRRARSPRASPCGPPCNRLPVGLVAEHRRAPARRRRRRPAGRGARRAEAGARGLRAPPLAQPVGGILAGQAVRHVLSARRWAEVVERDGGAPRSGELRPAAARRRRPSAAGLRRRAGPAEPDARHGRAEGRAGRRAASEEDLLPARAVRRGRGTAAATLRGRGERADAEPDGRWSRPGGADPRADPDGRGVRRRRADSRTGRCGSPSASRSERRRRRRAAPLAAARRSAPAEPRGRPRRSRSSRRWWARSTASPSPEPAGVRRRRATGSRWARRSACSRP